MVALQIRSTIATKIRLAADEQAGWFIRNGSAHYLVGMDLAQIGPQAAVDRYKETEMLFGSAPEDSCFAERPQAGRDEEAIRYFIEGVTNRWRGYGYFNTRRDWQWIAYYAPSLHEIRSDPRFQASVAVIEADIAVQRANVQAMRESGEIPPLGQLYPDKPGFLVSVVRT